MKKYRLIINLIMLIFSMSFFLFFDQESVSDALVFVYVIFMGIVTFINVELTGSKLHVRNLFIIFYLFYYGAGVVLQNSLYFGSVESDIFSLIMLGYIATFVGIDWIAEGNRNTNKTANNIKYINLGSATESRVLLYLLISLAISIMAIVLWFYQVGGIPVLAENIQVARIDKARGTYYARQFGSLAIPFFCFYLLSFLQGRGSRLVLLGAFLLISLILLSQAFRTFVISYWLICLLIYERVVIKKIKVKTLLAALTVIFLFAVVVGIVRYRSAEIEFISTKTNDLLILQPLLLKSVTLQKLMDIFPYFIDYQWGEMYTRGLGFLLPGRQLGGGMWLKQEVFRASYAGGGYNPGLLGEFYINFGVFGIAIGMLFFGALLAWFSKLGENEGGNHIILSAVWVTYLLIAMSPGIGIILLPLIWNTLLVMGGFFMLTGKFTVLQQKKRPVYKNPLPIVRR